MEKKIPPVNHSLSPEKVRPDLNNDTPLQCFANCRPAKGAPHLDKAKSSERTKLQREAQTSDVRAARLIELARDKLTDEFVPRDEALMSRVKSLRP